MLKGGTVMTKRTLGIETVLLVTAVILTSCGGMSLKLLDKTDIPVGWEHANFVLVKNFQNTEKNWMKLKEYGDKFDKNKPRLLIIFYSDESKLIPTNMPRIISPSTEGVIGIYNRMGGQGLLIKNSKYTQP